MSGGSVEAETVRVVEERVEPGNVRSLGPMEAAIWLGLVLDYRERNAPIPTEVCHDICRRHGCSHPAVMLNALAGKEVMLADGAKSNNKGRIPLSEGLVVYTGKGKNKRRVWPLAEASSAAAPPPPDAPTPDAPHATPLADAGPVRVSVSVVALLRQLAGAFGIDVPFVSSQAIERLAISNPSSYYWRVARLEAAGGIRQVGGTRGTKSDPAQFVVTGSPVVTQDGTSHPAIAPAPDAAPAPTPAGTKTKEELEAERDAVLAEIDAAPAPRLAWVAACETAERELREAEKVVEQRRAALDQLVANPVAEPDVADLRQRADALGALILHYDLLRK